MTHRCIWTLIIGGLLGTLPLAPLAADEPPATAQQSPATAQQSPAAEPQLPAAEQQPPASGPRTAVEPGTLVERLGDVSYAIRESAADRLQALGMAAKSALMEGMKHPDLEIRMRAHQILVRAMQDDFERRMGDFIADVEDKHDHGLPGWKSFREMVGGDPRSRRLFVEMLKHEADLLDAAENQPERLAEMLSQRVQNLQAQGFNHLGTVQEVEPASVAAILFLSSEERVKSNPGLKSLAYSVLNQPMVKEAIRGGSHAKQLKQLLQQWIVRTEDATQPYYGLMLALTYDLNDAGLELGRRYLSEKSAVPITLQYASIALGRFGSKQDLATLEPHLQNTTVCHTWSNPQLKKEPIKIEIRDIVLAMMIQLAGQNHRDYGYDLLEENPTYLFHLHTFGFLEDAQRDAALAKWKAWRQANPVKVESEASGAETATPPATDPEKPASK
jgi:hypothetical protein